MSLKSFPYVLVLFLVVSLQAFAQKPKEEQQDSLVRLVGAQRGELTTKYGTSYRKLTGNVRFLHNNTYLLCDSALWNVNNNIIDAMGNVSIIQEGTELKSDKLTYYVDSDLAQFRGSVVQLRDKDNNILRTRHLDYNTKDSIAVFQHGGSMKDKDGQVIESRTGQYDSKIKTFNFTDDVNMYTDSVFVKTTSLCYQSDLNLATFGHHTDAWKDDKMLSADDGWYDRGQEIFFFRDKVHVLSEEQEGWSDTLYFYKTTTDVDMFGNVQLLDTVKAVTALAGHLEYRDSVSTVTLTREPVIIIEMEEEGKERDTVYVGARKLVYYTIKKNEIPENVIAHAEKRLEDLKIDPIGEHRKLAAEAARKAKAEAEANDPNSQRNRPAPKAGDKGGDKSGGKPSPETPGGVGKSISPSDSTGMNISPADSIEMNISPTDSLEVVVDSTAIGFAVAVGDVKVFKKDMQVVCDSLCYSDLDSLARLFLNPVIWQEVKQQFSADSITVAIKNQAMEKASLMSNAFIHIQEDSIYFDQIKGTEMTAFFGEDGSLIRFDALGGAQAVFFLEENDAIATVNKKDCKMLSAMFKDGNLSRVHYYEEAKSDAYPVVQLSDLDKRLKGFSWSPERRPDSPEAITPLVPRASQRASYHLRPQASFRQTDIYFPGYMKEVYYMLDHRDSINAARAQQRELERQLEAERKRQLDSLAAADSIAALRDSLMMNPAAIDSLAVDSLAVDSPMMDSLVVDSAAADSLIAVPPAIDEQPTEQPTKQPTEPQPMKRPAEQPSAPTEAEEEAVTEKAPSPEELEKQRIAAEKAAEKRRIAAEKAAKKKQRAEEKAARDAIADSLKAIKIAEREQKWAELDARDAAKAAERQAKLAEKERKRQLKAAQKAGERAAKEAAMIEKYRQKLLKKGKKVKTKPGELDRIREELRLEQNRQNQQNQNQQNQGQQNQGPQNQNQTQQNQNFAKPEPTNK